MARGGSPKKRQQGEMETKGLTRIITINGEERRIPTFRAERVACAAPLPGAEMPPPEAGRAEFEFGRVTFCMTREEMSDVRRVMWKLMALGPET